MYCIPGIYIYRMWRTHMCTKNAAPTQLSLLPLPPTPYHHHHHLLLLRGALIEAKEEVGRRPKGEERVVWSRLGDGGLPWGGTRPASHTVTTIDQPSSLTQRREGSTETRRRRGGGCW